MKSRSTPSFMALSVLVLAFCASAMALSVFACAQNPPEPLPPAIQVHPADVSLHDLQTATFSVQASGADGYQWLRDGIEIPGATNPSYVIEEVEFSDSGDAFSVAVSNDAGTTTSGAAILTVLPNDPRTIAFTTEGEGFAPILTLRDGAAATVTWTFSDGTTSGALRPTAAFGSPATRRHTLAVDPWSAVRRINIGYNRGDGGSNDIELNDEQRVSNVENLDVVAPYLVEWCSSYNDLAALDFSHFTRLETIECFLSDTLTSVNLADTPRLRRACCEDCALTALDLSQSPALEDLRGALNRYPTIDFGSIGTNVWHICIRENAASLTDRTMFADTTQFPQIADLFIWSDNQTGALRIPSTSTTRNVEISANGNSYTTLDLRGSLQNADLLGTVSVPNNDLTSANLSGCAQINVLDLSYNDLGSLAVDGILAMMDESGRSEVNTPASADLLIDLRGNAGHTETGDAHAASLAGKGWTVYTEGVTHVPEPPADTGPITIHFSTTGQDTGMRMEVTGTPDIVWHWSDGSETTGISGARTDLGPGSHAHTVTVSNGAAVTRFGAAQGGGYGNLVSLSGLENCPYLGILYVYNEPDLVSIGRTNTTRTREYHLIGTNISPAEMDDIFADAVATGVTNGILYCANLGTIASVADRTTLSQRGWALNN